MKWFEAVKEKVKEHKATIIVGAIGGVLTIIGYAIGKEVGETIHREVSDKCLKEGLQDFMNAGACFGICSFGNYMEDKIPLAVNAISDYMATNNLTGEQMAEDVITNFYHWASENINIKVNDGIFSVDFQNK